MRTVKLTLPLILFFLLMLLLWKGLGLNPNEVPSPLINKPAPAFTLPQLLNAKKTASNFDFYHHVTLLNVWATWCMACSVEHPFLMELSKNKSVQIYGLNYKDDLKMAKKWLKKQGNPYRIIAVDSKGQTAIDWGVYGTPETFIIDKKGVIRGKQIGPLTLDVWKKKIEPLVRKLNQEAFTS